VFIIWKLAPTPGLIGEARLPISDMTEPPWVGPVVSGPSKRGRHDPAFEQTARSAAALEEAPTSLAPRIPGLAADGLV